MKIIKAIKDATTFLELHTNQSSQQCKIEAEEIFMFVFRVNKSRMYSSDTLLVSDQHLGHIYQILNKRKENIPLSYLLKKHAFYKHNFYVDENVLIPRSETESVIDKLLYMGDKLFINKNRCFFLDAGCGSGCVGITIANERPEWKVYLSDMYMSSLAVAKKNMEICKYKNVHLICADWLTAFRSVVFDFIFSNPPYIPLEDTRVEKSVFLNEPHSSLYSGEDGLDDIRKIIKSSSKVLCDTAILFLENGIDQAEKIRQQLELNDFTDICTHFDYNGHERFTSSRKIHG